MSNYISKYIIDRDKALESFDINTFIKFLENYESEITPDVVAQFKKSSPVVQQATICKMIVNIIKFRKTEIYNRAIKWLIQHDMSGDLR